VTNRVSHAGLALCLSAWWISAVASDSHDVFPVVVALLGVACLLWEKPRA
jgi:hypothetical protein